MSDADEDLEALFDEISAKSVITSQPGTSGLTKPGEDSGTESSTPSSQFDSTVFDSNSNKPMFERLGNAVRILHNSMRELGYDRSLTDVTSQITDAHERLDYIITLTEQAAHKVLNATDEGIPAQDELAQKAKDIEERWSSLFAGKMDIDAFKMLANDSRTFAKDTIASTEAEKARLLSIMMAQDFQDLTGQLIKKVVAITNVLEHGLAQILIDNAPDSVKEKTAELMRGPSAPHLAMRQDDVDNLLDNLGF